MHNPDGPDADPEASRARLAEWLAHWAEHGSGYWVVEADDGTVIGFCGVRQGAWQGRPVLRPGLVRRPDLEFELDGLWAVVFSEPEKGSPSAPRPA